MTQKHTLFPALYLSFVSNYFLDSLHVTNGPLLKWSWEGIEIQVSEKRIQGQNWIQVSEKVT